MSDELIKKLLSFRSKRDWEQFHNPKDLAISISLEAAELLEVFQWSGSDLERSEKKEQIKEELADIMMYCLYLSYDLGLDPVEIMLEKLEINKKKYPVEKAKGSNKKYTELD